MSASNITIQMAQSPRLFTKSKLNRERVETSKKALFIVNSVRIQVSVRDNVRVIDILDRSLIIGWRKERLKFERGSLVFTFSVCVCVCVCVCSRPTGHNFWPSNLNFCMKGPWDMSKKVFFSNFQNFNFCQFYGHFSFFS